MEKLSTRTAFLVIIFSLLIAKNLVVIKKSIAKQTSIQASTTTEVSTINSANQNLSDIAIATLEQDFYEQINEYRMSHHLPPLAIDRRISEQARHHSQAMANGQVPFSDQGFDLRSDAISWEIPHQKIDEIVAYSVGSTNPVKAIVKRLYKDSDRLKTIEGQYELTGVGIATNAKGEHYFTQIFVRRQPDLVKANKPS